MSNSLKCRIVISLIIGICVFLILCVLYQLIIPRKDWLIYSITWAIFWSIGYFVSKTKTLVESRKKIIYETLIIIIVFVIVVFLNGIINNLASCEYIPVACTSFTTSLILYSHLLKN